MALLRRNERRQGGVGRRALRRAERALEPEVHRGLEGIDHLVWDIEHGKFEQALSGLTAGAAVVTGAEIFLEHDRASFGNPWMWAPVALSPIAVAAGLAGVTSRRAAKTFLPLASLLVIANGLQGLWLHVRGIARRPGGWRMLRYNVEMGPPLFAPLMVTAVGGMGLLASVLRRS
jgi:hypothetical protein